jgi:hypothetical protein
VGPKQTITKGPKQVDTINRLSSNDDTAFREVDFLPDLGHHIPPVAWADQCGRDELGADVRFGEFLLVHSSDSNYAE